MSRLRIKPKSWHLYLSLPLMVGLLLIDRHLSLSPREHQLVQLVVVSITFLYMYISEHAYTEMAAREAYRQRGESLRITHVSMKDPADDTEPQDPSGQKDKE